MEVKAVAAAAALQDAARRFDGRIYSKVNSIGPKLGATPHTASGYCVDPNSTKVPVQP